jgi:hypothetical protein
MSKVVRIEKVTKDRVLAEFEDRSVAIFDLMWMLDGTKVYFVTLLDRSRKIAGWRIVPTGYADQ